MSADAQHGLSLAPFRAVRYTAAADRLGQLLCPPYDVVDEATRIRLLEADADNAIAIVLPRTSDGSDPYAAAADRLTRWVTDGVLAVDARPALYVYEMRTAEGDVTRGLVGAVELRDAADGVILPHEDTMAGPVADRLALMTATEANVEPIYLVYDGGGAASELVRGVPDGAELVRTTTPDGTSHRLWAVADVSVIEAVGQDLAGRHALIADGHHRYATYREMQRRLGAARGPGPWDRGLTLLVDTSAYGPQVHPIHRVLVGRSLDDAVSAAQPAARVDRAESIEKALAELETTAGFAAVLTNGERSYLLHSPASELLEQAREPGESPALAGLDVTVLHRSLVREVWRLADSVESVGYAHSVHDALEDARRSGGTAVLLRATPVDAVAAVAADGARMPRKSTLFTPKPASGLVMRRFADEL